MGSRCFIFRQIVFILLYSMFPQDVSSAFTDEQTRSIETFVSEYMACKGVPGLGIGIVKEDAVLARGFGLEDVDKKRNVTTDGTLFAIGSTTKAFTTVVLAAALEGTHGRLTWDSKVADVLGGDFRFIDTERTKLTTIKDLMAHRTGLSGPSVALSYSYDPSYTRADLARDIRYLEEEEGFRDQHRARIHPLEPAGGIVATVDDMMKWLKFLTADGRTEEGRQLMSVPMMKSMFEVHMFVPGDDKRISVPTFPATHLQRGYGLAWDIGNYRGFQFLWHDGSIGAHDSLVAVLPQFQLGIFISSNTMADLKPIVYYVVDLLLAQPQWLNSTSACSFPSPWIQENSNGSDSETDGNRKPANPPDTEIGMERYIGSYGHRVFGELQVSLNKSTQNLHLHYGKLQGPLVIEDTNKHVFSLNRVTNYVRFETIVKEKFQTFVFLDESVFYERGVRLSDPIRNSGCRSYSGVLMIVLAIHWMTSGECVYWAP
ncbi:uncharacterized protein LOC124281613 [Haliotis rubra]|uniref:uncharacterized protein LOC124281613 n=1 Tax=Haliotis rubra TaxID=36100 RepID=UPI001EE62449|nr:uncharacterized protein LOC124281613 [Haliotis rubra]